MFRDLEVGEVLGWDVGEMARDITVHAFVRAPFDQYVHDNSRFWNASGASVQLGANGLQVQVESLRALVLGGIAFETPDDAAGHRRKARPSTSSRCMQSRMRPTRRLQARRAVHGQFRRIGLRPGSRLAGDAAWHEDRPGAASRWCMTRSWTTSSCRCISRWNLNGSRSWTCRRRRPGHQDERPGAARPAGQAGDRQPDHRPKQLAMDVLPDAGPGNLEQARRRLCDPGAGRRRRTCCRRAATTGQPAERHPVRGRSART